MPTFAETSKAARQKTDPHTSRIRWHDGTPCWLAWVWPLYVPERCSPSVLGLLRVGDRRPGPCVSEPHHDCTPASLLVVSPHWLLPRLLPHSPRELLNLLLLVVYTPLLQFNGKSLLRPSSTSLSPSLRPVHSSLRPSDTPTHTAINMLPPPAPLKPEWPRLGAC